jgi:hypothetical protein
LLRIEYRDVEIVLDEETNEHIFEIKVRGKRGVGYRKSSTGAVMPFRRLQKRSGSKSYGQDFPKFHRELFPCG